MQTVIALTGFEHGRRIKKNTKFSVSPSVAKQLVENKLVRIVDSVPQKPAGNKSSASPAGQVSPQKTVKKSKRGETQAKEPEPSSSQTALL